MAAELRLHPRDPFEPGGLRLQQQLHRVEQLHPEHRLREPDLQLGGCQEGVLLLATNLRQHLRDVHTRRILRKGPTLQVHVGEAGELVPLDLELRAEETFPAGHHFPGQRQVINIIITIWKERNKKKK